jgi:Mrp family chromosome partitioning ATPase
VLPSGKPLDNSSEILGSPKMAALAEELKTRYHDRIVIYDMPPVLEQDDSIGFLPHVDATLVVVRDGKTPVDDLKTCVDRISGTNIIGSVLNDSGM